MNIQTGTAARAQAVARLLFEVRAVNFNTEQFYTYVSGIQSPLYVDNRRTISFPGARKAIVAYLVKVLADEIGLENFDLVAGVATGGIPWAAWVADRLDLPLVYVRPAVKDRGMARQVEGFLEPGARVVIIEDLITTGLSSSQVVETLRAQGSVIEDCASIFSYGTPAAVRRFAALGVRLRPLTTLESLLLFAQEMGSLDDHQVGIIRAWIDGVLAQWGTEAAP